MKIYRIGIRVRPKPEHMLFYDMQFGCLMIWISAKDEDDASTRATAIAEQLPYEIVGGLVLVQTLRAEATQHYESILDQTKNIGASFDLVMCPTGIDEGNFDQWFEEYETGA